MNKVRARGIRASRPKLRSAQLAAGFKSQAEVVDKIQIIEGLNKAPRSLVNRVFRGDAVDPLSIERVAKALNVEAWALYLDSAELEKSNALNTQETDPRQASSTSHKHKSENALDTEYTIDDSINSPEVVPYNASTKSAI